SALMSDLAQFGAYRASAFDKEYFFSEDDRKYHFYRLVEFERTQAFDSYEKYTEFMNKAKEDFRRTVDMIVYSVEKQAPTAPSFNASFKSAKYALDMSLTASLYTVMSFCIFLSAVIMGSEYTTGSIRLLLIRPQPRWKILLSKLLCLWIFTAAALIVIYTITPLTTVLIYGGGDLETKITVFKNGAIAAVSPLQNAIHKGLLGFISMFGISMLTFMLSLIIKKGTISAAVGIMVFGFGQSIAEFARGALYRMPFLKYTVLPYIMNLEYAEYNPLDRFLMSFDYTPVSAEYGLELSTGIVIIMLLTAIFVMLSFAIFDKQQIKN
ncbi:MAG: ABC transporter permease, partial [Ruminiclostridium sp.]|nr:ABC transporter permease [Ruminiclostridium sp.]